MLNKRGKVIGVTYATYDSNDSQNINYAINIKYLNKMYKAIEENDIVSITNKNYKKYVGELDNFNNYSLSKLRYYKVSSLEVWNKMTNVYSKFEYLLKNKDEEWYKIYRKLSVDEQKEVVSLFLELSNYEYDDDNIVYSIKNWDEKEFFISLNILKKYEYSIVSVDLKNYKNQNKKFNHVNNKYPLDAAEKTLILYLIGNYNWYDIHDDNKRDIFDFFDERYDVEECGAILEMLGYKIVYNKDDSFTAYW